MKKDKRYPRVGTAVFVVRNGLFVMGLRKGAHGEGTWSVPGGAVEFGETQFDTAHREVNEETGLGLLSVRTLGVTSDYNLAWDTHWYTIWLIAAAADGPLVEREPDKFTHLSWQSLYTLPSPLFYPLAQLRYDPIWGVVGQALDLNKLVHHLKEHKS